MYLDVKDDQVFFSMEYVINGGSKRTSMSVRLRYMFLFATIFGGCFLILTISNGTPFLNIDIDTPSILDQHNVFNDRFTIKTEGCSIPGLRPLDDAIKRYVSYPDNLQPCHDNNNNTLLDSNKTHIWVKHENYDYYNITSDSFECCYRSFYRPSSIVDIASSRIDDRVQYHPCIPFYEHIEVADEFVRVICRSEDIDVYEQFFLFVPKKEFISHDDFVEIPKNKSSYNVIVMGIDAVSRLNFHRTMPKTLALIKELGAVELLGYNKVGDNTFPNLIPMLLGIKETELKGTCLPHGRATFDNCPFIWEWYKQAGFFTALGEDSSPLGTFNYVKVGFSGTPTDYYIHTFIHEANRILGNNKDFNSNLCMNEKYFYKILLDYIQNLTKTLYSNRMFGFFWEITMSHDYLNYPMVMDDDYLNFFKSLNESKYLDETIIFLVSDHGIRWGGIRSTKQGRLEERLPFVHVLTPSSFREEYSEAFNNLKINSRRLTTPFDVHSTLVDLLNLDELNDEIILSRRKKKYSDSRGISLFLPIPDNRTCATAGIEDHWCTCHIEKKLPLSIPVVNEASVQLVRELNEQVKGYPQCAKLKLAEIIEVTEMEAGHPEKDETGWREFMAVVRTLPGNGVFEATLRQIDKVWSLTGTISRLNLYGEQSRCVHHYQLKLYCFCL